MTHSRSRSAPVRPPWDYQPLGLRPSWAILEGGFSRLGALFALAVVAGRPVKRTVVRAGVPSGVALTAQPLDGPGELHQTLEISKDAPRVNPLDREAVAVPDDSWASFDT